MIAISHTPVSYTHLSLLDEKSELDLEIQRLDRTLQPSASSASERELFEQLQAEMEGCSTQIGRKSEQLRLLNEDLLTLEKRSRDLEAVSYTHLDVYKRQEEGILRSDSKFGYWELAEKQP